MIQHALIFVVRSYEKYLTTPKFLGIVFQKIVCSLLYYKYNMYLCISKIDNGKEATYRRRLL